MKEHFKRYGWLYGVCAILVLWPLVLWRMQRVPPLDPQTIEEVAKWLDGEVERRYGQPLWREFESFEERWEKEGLSLSRDPRFERITRHYPRPGTGPAAELFKSDLDSLAEIYKPYFDEWDQLAQQGIFYVPRESLWVKQGEILSASQPSDLTPNFLMIQMMVKLRRTLADQTIQEGRWEDALSQLRSNAHMGDPLRTSALIGLLIDVACRAIAYSAYEALLSSDTPPVVEHSALEDLMRLRSTDPRLDPTARKIINTEIFQYVIPYEADWQKYIGFVSLGAAVDTAVERRESFSSQTLRSFGERYHEKYTREPGFSYLFRLFEYGGNRWTTIPASVKWLKCVADSEPSFFEPHSIPDYLLESLDGWTLALLFADHFARSDLLNEPLTRSRVTMTKGRLLEAAFAARLHYHEHGEWPASMEDLIPAYLPSFVEDASAATYSLPFLPFQIAWQEVDEDLRAILWDEVLPLEVLHSSRPPAKALQQGPMEIDRLSTSRDWLEQPVIPLALAEALQAHPKLVEKAEVEMTDREVPRGGDLSRWKDLVPWKPLEAEYARRVTDQSDALLWSSRRFDRKEGALPPDKRGENRPELTERTVEPPRAIRLTATLRAPERVLEIWSPGPDGEDDGGRIVYDPTNGTLSRGDMVIFPEGF